MLGTTRYPVPTYAANVAASPAGRCADTTPAEMQTPAVNNRTRPTRFIVPPGTRLPPPFGEAGQWYPCGSIVATQSQVQLPRSLAGLMTAAYPWLLAAILIVFIWQTVAARRAAVPPPPPSADAGSLNCKTLSHAVLLGPIPEASGLALSARTPVILWSMNDSGTPAVFAIDVMGRVLSSVRITGADVNNWEDVSVGPCGNGSCLYVADTGNGGGTQRNDVVIYRVPEPAPTDSRSAPAETFNAAYPADEDHESEAVVVAGGLLYLLTKGHPSLAFPFTRRIDTGTLATLGDIRQVANPPVQATYMRPPTRIT